MDPLKKPVPSGLGRPVKQQGLTHACWLESARQLDQPRTWWNRVKQKTRACSEPTLRVLSDVLLQQVAIWWDSHRKRCQLYVTQTQSLQLDSWFPVPRDFRLPFEELYPSSIDPSEQQREVNICWRGLWLGTWSRFFLSWKLELAEDLLVGVEGHGAPSSCCRWRCKGWRWKVFANSFWTSCCWRTFTWLCWVSWWCSSGDCSVPSGIAKRLKPLTHGTLCETHIQKKKQNWPAGNRSTTCVQQAHYTER